MSTLVKAFLAAGLSLALGLWLTQRSLDRGGLFDATRVGAWSLNVRTGAIDADPYARAGLAQSGEIPIGLGEGLTLVARTDDEGRPLQARCSYKIAPRAPVARYWTLELTDLDGAPVDNPSERYAFRSSELLREADGTFAVFVSASAHPGNWLPVGSPRPFELVLRLYDSPVSATTGGVDKATAPKVTRESCA